MSGFEAFSHLRTVPELSIPTAKLQETETLDEQDFNDYGNESAPPQIDRPDSN